MFSLKKLDPNASIRLNFNAAPCSETRFGCYSAVARSKPLREDAWFFMFFVFLPIFSSLLSRSCRFSVLRFALVFWFSEIRFVVPWTPPWSPDLNPVNHCHTPSRDYWHPFARLLVPPPVVLANENGDNDGTVSSRKCAEVIAAMFLTPTFQFPEKDCGVYAVERRCQTRFVRSASCKTRSFRNAKSVSEVVSIE